MRFGVSIPHSGSHWQDIRAFAMAAEEAGFDSIWLTDHLTSLHENGTILEGWTALSALSAVTTHVEVGIVLCQSFRPPPVVGKMISGADHISGGRLRIILGAGWFEAEYRAYGYDFAPAALRVDRLEETLRFLRGFLDSAGKPFTFDGQFVRVEDAVNLPAPSRRLPLAVGGTGPRLLRIAGRLADEWNCPSSALDRFEQLRLGVDDAAAAMGRAVRHSIKIPVLARGAERSGHADSSAETGLYGSVQQMADRVRELATAGVDDIQAIVRDRATLELLATALPELRAAG
jgi:alkanesulfonate monooxygenase SsuD/methylene tetrahydromethanopterin reductase-like flavin-dependent oxidoreductase (luciferase family)